MKKVIILAAAAALIVCSCGTTKQSTSTQSYVYQNKAVQNQESRQVTPAQNQLGKVKLELNDCQKAEMMEEDNMRAARSVRTYDIGEGKTMVEEEVRTLLATRIQSAVENAVKSYNKNVSANNNALSETRIRERLNKQFCAETVGGLRIVAQDAYAMPDGTLEVWICYEMKKKTDQVVSEILNEISADQELKIKFDEKQFEEEIKGEFEEFKKQRKG